MQNDIFRFRCFYAGFHTSVLVGSVRQRPTSSSIRNSSKTKEEPMKFKVIRSIPYNINAGQTLVGERLRLCLSILRREFIIGYDSTHLILSAGTYRTPLAGKSLKDIDFYLYRYSRPKERAMGRLRFTLRNGRGFSIPVCYR